jgi:hypothetical protein
MAYSLVERYQHFEGICYCPHLQGIKKLLYIEDGSFRFFQNTGTYLPHYMVSHSK